MTGEVFVTMNDTISNNCFNLCYNSSPYNLITNSQSAFYKMCKNSGEYELLLSNAKGGGQLSEAEDNAKS